jgi:hypothetical protein
MAMAPSDRRYVEFRMHRSKAGLTRCGG